MVVRAHSRLRSYSARLWRGDQTAALPAIAPSRIARLMERMLLPDNGDWAVERNRQFRRVRRRFLVALWDEFRVIWPIASGLVTVQLMLGALVSLLQEWPLGDAFYFTFVTAFTIGYGDLVPKGFVARLIAMVIGLTGVLLTGLIAAVGVRALQVATAESVRSPRRSTVVGPGNSEEN